MRERWALSIVGEGLRPSPHSGQALLSRVERESIRKTWSWRRWRGPFRDVFIRAKFQATVRRGVFRPKSRVSPRCVTAGRTLERRHCLPGRHQHRVEVTAASALPSDLHRQLDDRGGDLRQCLNALCPEFRFGHGGLSRFGFERCHGSSGAVRTVCVLAGAALVQSPAPLARASLRSTR